MEAKKGYKAIAKYILVSPSKVRPVADLVRGKGYVEAVAILEAMPQKGARLILKVLKSAGHKKTPHKAVRAYTPRHPAKR